MRRRSRQAKIDIVKVTLMAIAVVGGGWVWLFAPHHYVRWKMNDVVQVTLLEWADKSQKKAEDRFVRELDKREIPEYIIPEDCEFYEEQAEKHVECAWAVEVKIPLINRWEELQFVAHKSVNENRNLTDWGGD